MVKGVKPISAISSRKPSGSIHSLPVQTKLEQAEPAKMGATQIERHNRMIDAGLELFLQFGYRGVSMGAVAQKAGVAKPTLYKYFADKETLFVAGVVRFLLEAREICVRELAKPGTVETRIAGALAAKHKMFYRLVEGSVFADELYSESARIAAESFAEFEQWLQNQIERLLRQRGQEKAHLHTMLILACAFGIAKKAQRAEEIGPAIRLMVEKLLA